MLSRIKQIMRDIIDFGLLLLAIAFIYVDKKKDKPIKMSLFILLKVKKTPRLRG